MGDTQNKAAELKIRAERRAGELLAGTVTAGNPQLSHDVTIKLDDLGISRKQSSRWQQEASVPVPRSRRIVVAAKRPNDNARRQITVRSFAQSLPPFHTYQGGACLPFSRPLAGIRCGTMSETTPTNVQNATGIRDRDNLSPPIPVRFDTEVVSAIEAYGVGEVCVTRSEAVRRLVRRGLLAEGLLPVKGERSIVQ
jgi:hypothetical protein